MSAESQYARAVDALVSAPIRPRRVEALHALHEAAAGLVDEPMPLSAARRILEAVPRDRTVFLLTGVYDPIALPFGETDGPPGVVSLARALDLGIGAKPVVICEEPVLPSIELTCVAAGMLPVRDPEHARRKPHAVLLQTFPIASVEASRDRAQVLLDQHAPAAVISVERIGWNPRGRYHYVGGLALPQQAHVECLVEAAARAGVLTVGVGDGGNEIGMGAIIETVRDAVPYGRRCQCDCQAGIACTVPTDALVVANTSNLGSYGIAACMGLLLRQPALVHDRAMEGRFLEAVAAARCMDAGFISPTVDGTGDLSLGIAEVLQKLVAFGCAGR